jgi:hypothetical protein
LLFKLSFLGCQLLALRRDLGRRYRLARRWPLGLCGRSRRALRFDRRGSNDRFPRWRRLRGQSLRYRRRRRLERLLHLLRFCRINVLPAAFGLRVFDRLSRARRRSCRYP